jgi:uncharacterized membrane protein
LNRLVTIGFLLVVVGVVVVILGASSEGSASAGGFILVGPFPIVFGTGTNGGELAILSVILGVIMVVLLVVMASRLRTSIREGEGQE